MRKVAAIALLASLMLGGVSAYPNPIPALTIQMYQSNITIDATPASAVVSVTFTGNVSVDKLARETITVTLSTNASTGWASQVSPGNMTFTVDEPQNFTVTVIVPQSTGNVTANVEVTAKGVGGGFNVIGVTQSVLTVKGAPAQNGTGGNPGADQSGGTNTTAPVKNPEPRKTPGFEAVAGVASIIGAQLFITAVRRKRNTR